MFLPALMVAFSLVASLTASIAWFTSTTMVEKNNLLDGGTKGAYFAYGDGKSAGTAYGIKHPVHLYNLAWLQYLGFINDGTIGAGENKITYFELADDLDMTGWVIPPIGTEANPFFGIVNGQNHTVSNLTVSNNFADYGTTHPTAVNSNIFTAPHIVGLFGVVGSYNNINNTEYTSNIYNTSANAIYAFNINGATIKTGVADSLMGVVAGYVNGPITNVGVSASSIDTSGQATTNYTSGAKAFTNISDYSVVGYCEDEYKETTKRTTTTMYQPLEATSGELTVNQTGDTQGWGGSISMNDLFNHVSNVKTAAVNAGAPRYPSRRTIRKDENDIIIEDTVTAYGQITNMFNRENPNLYDNYSNNGWFADNSYNYYNYEQRDGNYVTSSYSIVNYNNSNFTCLTGEKTINILRACQTTEYYYVDVENAFFISQTNDDITNYLSILTTQGDITTSSINNQTSSDYATAWSLDENNRLYTTINDTTYYLKRNGTNLALVTLASDATSWETDGTFFYNQDSTNAYFIIYENDAWGIETVNKISGLAGQVITDGNGNYLTCNDTGGFTNATNEHDATKWTIDNGYISTVIRGKTYYLYIRRSGNFWNYQYTLVLSDSESNKTQFTFENNTIYYAGFLNISIYVLFNNGWKGQNGLQGSGTAYPKPSYNHSYLLKTDGSNKTAVSKTYTEDAQLRLNPTFFPLKNTNGIPHDTNTGYVISGGNYWGDQFGDIRFGRFAKDTYLPDGLNTIYTIQSNNGNSISINNSDIVADEERNKVFLKSKETLQDALKTSTNIDGIHFMNAEIGGIDPPGFEPIANETKRVIVPKAVINRQTYYNYEMPTDCIDFHLKEKGYINFFAGSYFQNRTSGVNNSFFSIHEIERGTNENPNNPTPIRDVNEIVQILSDGNKLHSYVYKYSDNTYSVPFMFETNGNSRTKIKLDGTAYTPYSKQNDIPTGYNTIIFDSDWIGINTLIMNGNAGYAYYFDIGMNDGEYALGSVYSSQNNTPSVGAYLMYLDIGANAEKINRTAFFDITKISTQTQTYPIGVFILDAATTASGENTYCDEKKTYCICIGPTYNGKITLNRSSETQGVVSETYTSEVDPETPVAKIGNIYLSYSHSNMIVTNSSGTQFKPTSTAVDTLIERITYYEYHQNTDTTTKMEVIRTTTDNGTLSPIITTTKQGYVLVTQNGKSTWVKDDTMNLYYDLMWGDGSSEGISVTNLDTYFDYLYVYKNDENSALNKLYSTYQDTTLANTTVLQIDANLYGATSTNTLLITITPSVTTTVQNNAITHTLNGYQIVISYVNAEGTIIELTEGVSIEATVATIQSSKYEFDSNGQMVSTGTIQVPALTFTINNTAISSTPITITIPTP